MSSSSWINLDALWKIVVVGLLLGAGLPALFAVGLRALTPAEGTSERAGGAIAGKAVAVLCFAIVLAAIAWGIYSIVNQS
jgi:hypothetical protein